MVTVLAVSAMILVFLGGVWGTSIAFKLEMDIFRELIGKNEEN